METETLRVHAGGGGGGARGAEAGASGTCELALDRLTKQFGPRIAVDHVTCTLKPGLTALLGANGAGKTTLMRMITTVIRPSSGTLAYCGRSLEACGEQYRSSLGYLPQHFGYYPNFTCQDFLLYLGACKGMSNRVCKARCRELLGEVGLEDRAKTKVKHLSGGMKQRLGIAQALLNNPHVLVLDEPTAGLDPKERVRFRNLIASLASQRIVLFSTHIVSDISSIASRIMVMRAGSIVLDDTPSRVVSEARCKVWELNCSREEADTLALQSLVANVRYAEDGSACVRIVEDVCPDERARAVEPGLEDLYLYMFRDDAGLRTSAETASEEETSWGD